MSKEYKKKKWKKISEREKDKIIDAYNSGITTKEIIEKHRITQEHLYSITKKNKE